MTDGFGLGDAYGATIERIKAQGGDKSRLGMEALMWISHAERSLRADELCHALAVELGSKNFNGDNAPSISTLVSCCQGLITVDKEASTVRLIHFTLQEYLSAPPGVFSTPHSAMAEICLTYLNSEPVKLISADPSSTIAHDEAFLRYCSVYWGVHAKRDPSDYARSLALELFQEYDGHISAKLLFEEVEAPWLGDFGTNFLFNGLHCASFFGIVEIVATLIEMGYYDINEGDFGGNTPLSWAAHNGHDEVVKLLLRWEKINPNKPNGHGQTPLALASWSGRGGAVKLLLRLEEVNPDKPDDSGRTPLSYAAWGGHERVVKLLLRREEVNPDQPDNHSRTPLSYAVWGGHEEVVTILLKRKEVSPDKPDIVGRTPLSYAAQDGHEAVVKILLGREEVNPDKPDNSARTPLWHAASGGHEGVVKILLGREEVNPRQARYCRPNTPLARHPGSEPKRPLRSALGTTGLTQAFSETTGPDSGKAALQNQSWARPGSPAGFPL